MAGYRIDPLSFADQRARPPLPLDEAARIGPKPPLLAFRRRRVPAGPVNRLPRLESVLGQDAFGPLERLPDEDRLEPVCPAHLDGDRRDPRGRRDRPERPVHPPRTARRSNRTTGRAVRAPFSGQRPVRLLIVGQRVPQAPTIATCVDIRMSTRQRRITVPHKGVGRTGPVSQSRSSPLHSASESVRWTISVSTASASVRKPASSARSSAFATSRETMNSGVERPTAPKCG